MPATTIEQLEQRETRIRKKLAEQTKDADPVRRRGMRKRLRRAQRKRRRLTVADTRRKAKSAGAAAAPAE